MEALKSQRFFTGIHQNKTVGEVYRDHPEYVLSAWKMRNQANFKYPQDKAAFLSLIREVHGLGPSKAEAAIRWKEEHPERVKEYREREKRKDRVRVTCDCGESVRRSSMIRHKGSRRHLRLLGVQEVQRQIHLNEEGEIDHGEVFAMINW